MATDKADTWRGYSLRELRYVRAGNAARTEADKQMLTKRFDTFRRGNPVTRSWQSARSLFSAIGYVNSAVLAFSLLRRLRNIVRMAKGR